MRRPGSGCSKFACSTFACFRTCSLRAMVRCDWASASRNRAVPRAGSSQPVHPPGSRVSNTTTGASPGTSASAGTIASADRSHQPDQPERARISPRESPSTAARCSRRSRCGRLTFPSFQPGDITLAKRHIAVVDHPVGQLFLAPAELQTASLDGLAKGLSIMLFVHLCRPITNARHLHWQRHGATEDETVPPDAHQTMRCSRLPMTTRMRRILVFRRDYRGSYGIRVSARTGPGGPA